MTLLDVIIPVHSTSRPITRAVSSALASLNADITVTVVCHNVSEQAIAAELVTMTEDRRLRLISLNDESTSPAAPRNFAISRSDADYLAFLDSDDEYEPGALDAWLRELTSGPDLLIGQLSSDSGRVLAPLPRVQRFARLDLVRDLLPYRTALHGVLVRRELLQSPEAPRYDERYRNGEDIGIGLSLLALAKNIAYSRSASGYQLHTDGTDRVTGDQTTADQLLAPVGDAIVLPLVRALPRTRRRAVAVKLIRIQVLELLKARLRSGQLDEQTMAAAARATRALLAFGPGALGMFNHSDARVIRAMAAGARARFVLALERGEAVSYRWKYLSVNPFRSLASESFFIRSWRAKRVSKHLKTANAEDRPSMLIVSFSDIAADARVRKQVDLFAKTHTVTTCGRGAQYRNDVEHLPIAHAESRLRHIAQALLLRLRLHRMAFALEPEVRVARRVLRGRRFDVAIADDAESISVAAAAAGAEHTVADLHEYWPGVHDQVQAWVRLRQPYYRWMMRRYAARAGAATTVSQTIADRYQHEFGFVCGVVRNATPFADVVPTPVGHPIRLVHSGGAQPNRKIEVMMEAAAAATSNIALDLYLTHEDTPYGQQLRDLADRLGPRITVHPPKPQSELVQTLNAYDVGIHVLPATNTNNQLALPNKFFDFVQARLGMIIGPTVDMARLLEENQLGVAADGFEIEDVRRVIDTLDADRVREWKHNADRAARELCAENEEAGWLDAIASVTS